MSDQRWHLRAVPLPDGEDPVDWWVSEGRLTSRPVPGASDLPGDWVAPGLVDAHVHLTFEARPRLGLDRGRELVDAHLALQRRAGVLAVRDAGSVPGAPPLPDGVIACGPFLAPPDFFLPHLYEGTPPAAAVEVARERVRAGWPWVKVIADYPADGNPFAAALGYPFELLRRIADAVHEEGSRLAAHVMGPIVREVVEAGVDSIEHGNWADERTVEEMAARGTAWTPTLTTVMGHVVPLQDRLPAARELIALQRRTLPLAADLGVVLLAGTDEEPHGSLAAEAAALAEFGVPLPAAVAAASTGARAYLGLPGLEEGAPADLVTFSRDPRQDITALASPAAVLAGGCSAGP
jgi:imidazolonepropionase-like amidohydrolase